MNNSILARAYTEILEIISNLPIEEYSKISIKRIEFFKEKSDKNYKDNINSKIELDGNTISKEVSAILIILFKHYFSQKTERNLLQKNQEKLDEENKKNIIQIIFLKGIMQIQ